MKKFNVAGLCVPGKHYMVNTKDKLLRIMNLIQDEQYFTINRARQYGKTTTIFLLEKAFASNPEFNCISISFEGVGAEMFENDEKFCRHFLLLVSRYLQLDGYEFADEWFCEDVKNFIQLGEHISKMCAGKKVVLMIDEVDATCKNSVFLRFLAMLRNLYLQRPRGKVSTFHSVLLAGVHDIKNIKLKLITVGLHSLQPKEGEYNSPWNIAADFEVEMSFSPEEITSMLEDYEADHGTNMCIKTIAYELYRYTNGYPFLVSRLCQLIEEALNRDWTIPGVQDAVKIITSEKNTLFDDLFKNLVNTPEINELMYAVLLLGNKRARSRRSQSVEWGELFGYLRVDRSGELSIANKIFEVILIDHFVIEEAMAAPANREVCYSLRDNIIAGGIFNMELCLRKFAEFYNSVYSEEDIPALERHARLIFLAYLHPLVNGYGFYHIESQFTDARRMDVVLDYGKNQYIVELKLWYGEVAHRKAFSQLLGYMNAKNVDQGYLLTFDLRSKKNRQPKAEWISIDGKQIFDVVV